MFEFVLYGLLVLGFSFVLFFIYFYRDPERFPPARNDIIVSPADGKIVYVKKIAGEHFICSSKGNKTIPLREIVWMDDVKTSSGFIIGIFMSRFDVHVNRAPISGKIIRAVHKKGKFLPMIGNEFEHENERNVVVIKHGDGFSVVVVQIASFTVRRIDCYVREGESVKIGERIGMVKLGSQVDLILPELPGLKIVKKQGDTVRAGETIIAEFQGKPM